MLEWLKRQLNKIKDFFARFWKATPVSSVSEGVSKDPSGDNIQSVNIPFFGEINPL